MERSEARSLGALYTCTAFYIAKTALLLDERLGSNQKVRANTYQSPTLLGYLVYTRNRFHEHLICDACLRYPYCTKQVYPTACYGLLERSAFIRAQDA